VCVSPLLAIIVLINMTTVTFISSCYAYAVYCTQIRLLCINFAFPNYSNQLLDFGIKVHLHGCCVHCTVCHLHASQIMFFALNIYSTHHCIFPYNACPFTPIIITDNIWEEFRINMHTFVITIGNFTTMASSLGQQELTLSTSHEWNSSILDTL
jgi:hypothetical protein